MCVMIHDRFGFSIVRSLLIWIGRMSDGTAGAIWESRENSNQLSATRIIKLDDSFSFTVMYMCA